MEPVLERGDPTLGCKRARVEVNQPALEAEMRQGPQGADPGPTPRTWEQLGAAVCSTRAHSGGGASSWATKSTVEKMHVRCASK
eukprot:3150967-Pyramimonas_sp.AAC.1